MYQRRIFGGFIEIGQKFTGNDGTTYFDWQPSLKLGAKTGDSWKWLHAGERHQFTVSTFAEHKGRASIVVLETITRAAPLEQYFEIRHVYVKDIGEVERQESARLASGQMRVVSLMTLIEDEDLVPPAKPPEAKNANSATDLRPNKSQ